VELLEHQLELQKVQELEEPLVFQLGHQKA
jgi:hypothetical protein